MKIETRDFGTVEIDPRQVIRFRAPIFGFEEETEYVLLSDDSTDGLFTWLQAVGNREVCFILIDPQIIWGEYYPELMPETKTLLGLTSEQPPVFRVIAVIPEDFAQSTVNLKSPVVINPAGKCAAQVILEADYPVRAPLVSQEGAGC